MFVTVEKETIYSNSVQLLKIVMENDVSARKAAKKLGKSHTTISAWCRQGRIPGVIKMDSNIWLIPESVTIDDIDTPNMGRPTSNEANGVEVSNQEG